MNILARPLEFGRSATRLNHGQEARRLLRAILRECSYLPDAEARLAIKQQVLQTFRATERKVKTGKTPAIRELTLSKEESEKLKIQNWLRKGYHGLRQLQRANEGELRPLAKVLHYTYGRGGQRRHELLHPILSADVLIPTSDSLEEHLKSMQASEEPQKWDLTTIPASDVFGKAEYQGDVVKYPISARYGRLQALVRSQSQTPLPDINGRPNTRIRSDVCKIPAKNIWGRSMPRRRAKNMLHKWYTLVVGRLLPPLPEHEWMHLRGKVNGTVKWEGAPQRRARPLMKPETLTTFDLEKLLRVTEAPKNIQAALEQDQVGGTPQQTDDEYFPEIANLSRSRFPDEVSNRWLTSQALRDESMQDILKDNIGAIRPLDKRLSRGSGRGHQITHRLMKRLWTQVFTVCPMLTKVEGSEEWKVTWGSVPVSPKATPAADSFLPLFPDASIPSGPTKIRKGENSASYL